MLKAVHSPHILHLSTHGFFLPAPEPTKPPRAVGPESFATTFRHGLVENPLLRCGLALAGAKTVLASLWSVPDLETKDLMVEFYRRYLSDEKMSKSEALRQAQLAVIEPRLSFINFQRKIWAQKVWRGASGVLGRVCVYWGAVTAQRAEGIEQRAWRRAYCVMLT